MITTILLYALQFVLAAGLAMVLHEGGHWLAAKAFKTDISFKMVKDTCTFKLFGKEITFSFYKGVWQMPEGLSKTQQRIIAAAGFGTEITVALIMAFTVPVSLSTPFAAIYCVIAFAHICLYKKYADDANDFQWFD